MPNQDKTGPKGIGPLTGRGLGPCGNGISKGCNRNFRCGMGRGRFQNLNSEQEKVFLKQQKEEIETRLKELN